MGLQGGAIYIDGGNVSFNTCQFYGNSAAKGGAVYATLLIDPITFTNCSFIDNTALFDGGAVYLAGNGGGATFTNSTLKVNEAGRNGGGIYYEWFSFGGINPSLTLEECSIRDNLASGGNGGGVYINGLGYNILRCTFSNNQADQAGGGIWTNGAGGISSSTISGNSASAEGGGVYFAVGFGGVPLISSLTSNTITANTSQGNGGGIYINALVVMTHVILAGNTSNAIGEDLFLGASGQLSSFGYNLIGTSDGSIWAPTLSDMVGTDASPTDPLLGPLQDNGGNTLTHELLVGSPATNAGNAASLTEITDQRGISFVDAPDIGAFEDDDVFYNIVFNTNNSGAGSLPQVISDVSSGDTIFFDPSLEGAVIILNACVAIDKDITLMGIEGLDPMAISGGGSSHLFSVVAGVVFKVFYLDLINADNVSGFPQGGFAPENQSPCTSSSGAAIHNEGTVYFQSGKISSCYAGSNGGGIYNASGANLVITEASFVNNWATRGGAIFNAVGGTASLENIHFYGRNGADVRGACIVNEGTLLLENATIEQVDNSVWNGGGAIYVNGSTSLENVTISQNYFQDSIVGGAIYIEGDTVTLTNVTITDHTFAVDQPGTGIYVDSAATLKMVNTLIAENRYMTEERNIFNAGGNVWSLGTNLVSDTTGANMVVGAGDILGNPTNVVDALVDSLDDYGGGIHTVQLKAGSPALNAGTDGVAPTSDQRGFGRFGQSDIGAFERQSETQLLVFSSLDGVEGSLSFAIMNAIAGDTILFDPLLVGDTLTLDNTLLIDKSVFIQGLGKDSLFVTASDSFPLFDIAAPATIANLHFFGGINMDGNGGAGIIRENTTILSCAFSNNRSELGGAIYVTDTADLDIELSVFENNQADSLGGAIYSEGTVMMEGSAIRFNLAKRGAGIYASEELTIIQSTLNNNVASEYGGGVYMTGTATEADAFPGILHVQNSTLSENQAFIQGGGIMHVAMGRFRSLSNTIAFNISSTGAGMYASGDVELGNTIVARNQAVARADVFLDGTNTSLGYNLIGDANLLTISGGTGDLFGSSQSPIDPILGALQENGGVTETHALLCASPASQAGDALGLGEDQRGISRETPTDIGSYQANIRSVRWVTSSFNDGTGSLRATVLEACPGDSIFFDGSLDSPILLSEPVVLDKNLLIDAQDRPFLELNGGGSRQILQVTSDATINLKNLTLKDGFAVRGGAVYSAGNMVIEGVSFLDNRATAGGAIYMGGVQTQSLVKNSTFSQNTASLFGGAIYDSALNTLDIIHSTLIDNVADSIGGGVFYGGGGFVGNSVFFGGLADGDYQDIYAADVVTSVGHNFIFAAEGTPIGYQSSDSLVADPMLEAISTVNGGFTPTYHPLRGSPLIDKISGTPEIDQRGFQRGSLRDIGAVEYIPVTIDTVSASLCSGGDYIEIDTLRISDPQGAGFGLGTNQTLLLGISQGYEFLPGVGGASSTTSGGDGLVLQFSVISSTQIAISYDHTVASPGDVLKIYGLQIKADTSQSVGSTANIFRAGGSAIIRGISSNLLLVNTEDILANLSILGTVPTPPVLSPSNALFCSGRMDTLVLSAVGTNIQWFNANDSIMGTGDSLRLTDTDLLLGSQFIYASQNDGSCFSLLDSVEVIASETPIAPIVLADANFYCQGATLGSVYAIGGDSATIRWYLDRDLINFVIQGDSISMLNLGLDSNDPSITTFYATQTVGNCESLADSVTISVQALPSPPNASNVEICQGESILPLFGSGTNLTWYADGNRDTLLGLGTTFTVGLSSFVAQVEDYYVTASVNGCESAPTQALYTINPLPAVLLSVADSVSCINDPAIAFNVAPNGGALSGPGVSGGVFTPSSAGMGIHLVAYTYTDGNGCTNSDNVLMTVNSLPSLGISGLNAQYCQNDSAVNLSGNPSGGAFSGMGIVGSSFRPFEALAGTHTIEYTYTDTATACVNTVSANVTVDSLSDANLLGLQATYCLNENPDILTVVADAGIGSSISGIGVLNTGTSIQFEPTNAGIGGHTITLTYVDSTTGCQDIVPYSTTVLSLPTSQIIGLDSTYCASDSLVTLSGVPSGGIFEVNSAASSVFNPANNVGISTITYTVTDPNTACSNTDLRLVEVSDIASLGVLLDTDHCLNADGSTLIGVPSNGSFVGDGVVFDGTSYQFEPSQAGIGSHTLSYLYTNTGGCTSQLDTTVIVYDLPSPTLNATIASTYCVDDSTIFLNPTPPGGVFSGSSGLIGGNFDPGIAGAGIDTLVYTVTDSVGCQGSVERVVEVTGLPQVSLLNVNPYYCSTDSQFVAFGNPIGGVMIIDDFTTLAFDTVEQGYVIHPDQLAIGPHDLEYTYTDGNGCENTVKFVFEIDEPLSIQALNNEYCATNDTIELEGRPGGGEFAINGTLDSLFLPAVLGAGTYIVEYTNTNQVGCATTISQTVEVNALPMVAILNLDSAYCANDSRVSLQGTPLGGNFMGEGVVNGGTEFDPDDVTSGSSLVTYEYTDANGCENEDTLRVVVNSIPTVTTDTLEIGYCGNAAPIVLSGQPAGGVFFGNSVSNDSILDPSMLPPGPVDAFYAYTDANGCSDTIQMMSSIHLIAGSSISGIRTTYCLNEPADTIIVSPTGGVFLNSTVVDGAFVPSLAGVGVDTISYVFTDMHGCLDTTIFELEVFDLPQLTILDLATQYCERDPIDTLQAFPGGGSFGGLGINVGAGAFNPMGVPVDSNLVISYSYTDANQCTNVISASTMVLSTPDLLIVGLDSQYCENDAASQLTGLPVGGNFFGDGMNGTTFTPTSTSVGNNTVSYAYLHTNGCRDTAVQSVRIDTVPNVSLLGLDPSYCRNNPNVILEGNPIGGEFFGDAVIDSVFIPGFAPIGTEPIEYVFEDENGCRDTAVVSTEIFPLPAISIGTIDSTYCLNDPSIDLIGIPTGGTFIVDGVEGDSIFDPMIAEEGLSEIEYTYTDANGCTDTAEVETSVLSLPNVQIWNLNAGYCADDNALSLVGFPSTNATFFGDGVVNGLFYPNLIIPDSLNIVSDTTLVFLAATGSNGCRDTIFQPTVIYKNPSADFDYDKSCIFDSIQFTHLASDVTVTSWEWNFGDGESSILENPQHSYNTKGIRDVSLFVESDQGCRENTSQSVAIGEIAISEFSWHHICEGDSTIFTETLDLNFDTLESITWTFGDGNVTTGGNPKHLYATSEHYTVIMDVLSVNGCATSDTAELFILPYIHEFSYFTPFDTVTSDWVSEGVNSSWAWGTPDTVGITPEEENEKLWMTGLDTDYNLDEQSYVYSPCFDFTNINRPMVTFDYYSQLQEEFDGAALQYSIDDGDSWSVLGNQGTGLNWYDGSNINGNPGVQQNNQVGWTSANSGWKHARHRLDLLGGNAEVRFRFAFGSDGGNPSTGDFDGFAFDNFFIGSRDRLVLLENFTNGTTFSDYAHVYALMDNNNTDIIPLQYHVGFPNTDDIHMLNTADPNARATFYGVTNAFSSVVDGVEFNGASNDLNQLTLNLGMLEEPAFEISFDSFYVENGLARVQAHINSIDSIGPATLSVHTVIAEKDVLAGGNLFRNIVRKMLPTAAGTIYTQTWNANSTVSVDESWTISNVNDLNNLLAVVFIQNHETKQIYQVKDRFIDGAASTNLDPSIEAEPNTVRVYPNPVDDELFALFKFPLKEEGSWKLSDMRGVVLQSGNATIGSQGTTLSVQELANGLYIFELESEGVRTTTKVVVNH